MYFLIVFSFVGNLGDGLFAFRGSWILLLSCQASENSNKLVVNVWPQQVVNFEE